MFVEVQCRRQDLNLHALDGHQALNLARLPIPPLRLVVSIIIRRNWMDSSPLLQVRSAERQYRNLPRQHKITSTVERKPLFQYQASCNRGRRLLVQIAVAGRSK